MHAGNDGGWLLDDAMNISQFVCRQLADIQKHGKMARQYRTVRTCATSGAAYCDIFYKGVLSILSRDSRGEFVQCTLLIIASDIDLASCMPCCTFCASLGTGAENERFSALVRTARGELPSLIGYGYVHVLAGLPLFCCRISSLARAATCFLRGHDVQTRRNPRVHKARKSLRNPSNCPH